MCKGRDDLQSGMHGVPACTVEEELSAARKQIAEELDNMFVLHVVDAYPNITA